MLKQLWMVVISIFTLFNVTISAYMSYNTIKIAVHKCKCALTAYWYMIIAYFLFSGVFLVYLMLITFNMVKPRWVMGFLLVYLFTTLGFAGGSFAYTKYLTSKQCNCVSTQYTLLLKLISFFRVLMAIISLLALLIWGIYVVMVDRK